MVAIPAMEPKYIALSDLLLDPNNYRLQEAEGFAAYPKDRFHIDRVQDATRKRLRNEQIEPLKNSILSNGFLEIERIVVCDYEFLDGKYLVIEGNRRVAALMSIQDDYEAGIEISEKLVPIFGAVPCLVATNEQESSYFREAIMGIRHVGGIREWGGFQRAKLIADLKDRHELDASAISDRIGISAIEVNRRYRAYKALQQMQNDEEYGDFASPLLYPLFHEAVSIPTIRDWVGWDSDANEFRKDDIREIFYQLISPRRLDENEERPPKIRTYSDVRSLRDILSNDDAKAELIAPDRELVDALAIASQGKMSQRWRAEVNEAKSALSKLPALELQNLDKSDVEIIESLIEVAHRVLELHRKAVE